MNRKDEKKGKNSKKNGDTRRARVETRTKQVNVEMTQRVTQQVGNDDYRHASLVH